MKETTNGVLVETHDDMDEIAETVDEDASGTDSLGASSDRQAYRQAPEKSPIGIKDIDSAYAKAAIRDLLPYILMLVIFAIMIGIFLTVKKRELDAYLQDKYEYYGENLPYDE